ncbi:hypothetical protein I6F35_16565 [Bradyrhizobium sp. BRP22]|uniref:hypothetical protein n=1 Tax=Bradyrhizobium sp. BRP22 TaxID=2793821 RepID=UPI001CD80E08|nr:hypothetical protein [Bradyrhizobium sp. BRP22]MCA1454823.1 hypothetical protein [Bradyrhizobium sp. BRP22]
MSETSLGAAELPLFHPAAHYDSPADVLTDPQLSRSEKRVILSSWASDMFAVESCPGLREIPGIGHSIRLADILAALRQLDDDEDPPPCRGIAPQRRLPTNHSRPASPC